MLMEPPKRDPCEQLEIQVWSLRIGIWTRESKSWKSKQIVVVEFIGVEEITQKPDAESWEIEMFRGDAEMSRPPRSECRAAVNAAVESIHKCVLNSEFGRFLKWAKLVSRRNLIYSGWNELNRGQEGPTVRINWICSDWQEGERTVHCLRIRQSFFKNEGLLNVFWWKKGKEPEEREKAVCAMC